MLRINMPLILFQLLNISEFLTKQKAARVFKANPYLAPLAVPKDLINKTNEQIIKSKKYKKNLQYHGFYQVYGDQIF